MTERSTTLKDLQLECWQIAEDHGFHDVGQTFGDKIALIHSELSEALEDFRADRKPNETWYPHHMSGKATKPCGIPSELADVIIRVLDMAQAYDIDLEAMVIEKMAFNRTRPYLHGKTM